MNERLQALMNFGSVIKLSSEVLVRAKEIFGDQRCRAAEHWCKSLASGRVISVRVIQRDTVTDFEVRELPAKLTSGA